MWIRMGTYQKGRSNSLEKELNIVEVKGLERIKVIVLKKRLNLKLKRFKIKGQCRISLTIL